MSYVIGLDLGNINILTSIIDGIDEKTRKGGMAVDIIPPDRPAGIPSAFYYSQVHGVRLCEAAYDNVCRPDCRFTLLKRSLNGTFTSDGKEFSYNDALAQVTARALDTALDELEKRYHTTTDLVSLAYPAAFLDPGKLRLKEIIESIELRNGNKAKVVGMISEPAAAALDYLASNSVGDSTVLVCDLGGGTYDLALVQAYPDGKTDEHGILKYYDCLDQNGINVGGDDFTSLMYELLLEKLDDIALNDEQKGFLRRIISEDTKLDLSRIESTYPMLQMLGIFSSTVTVTREEFREKTSDLLTDIVSATRKMLENPHLPKPDLILLTGGGSNMLIFQDAIKEAFPEYNGRIIPHAPHCAVSHGTARYGSESDMPSPIILRTAYAYGMSCYKGSDLQEVCRLMIPAGTPYPYDSGYVTFRVGTNNQTAVSNDIYQAKTKDIRPVSDKERFPNVYEIDGFEYIIGKRYEFGRTVERGKDVENRLYVDENGILHLFIRDPADTTKEVEFMAGSINEL